MKKGKGSLYLCILLALLLSLPTAAGALTNSFETASTSAEGSVWGNLGLSSRDDYFSLFVSGHYGYTEAVELSARGGLLTVDRPKDDKTGVLLGVGGKMRAAIFGDPSYPEVALFASYDFGFADGKALHSLEGGVLASKNFMKEDGSLGITPYGGPSIEVLGGSLSDDTDINIHLTAGARITFQSQFSLSLEAKVGGTSSYGISLNYQF
ncbi:MAG: hypothetical protein D6713_03615 [Deltaproteobacteria bacterium]|nr:MAG: hypothetical protein D6713_03615 [Deltaproteobacteria bacterium]